MSVALKVTSPPAGYFKEGVIGGKVTMDAAFYVKDKLAIILTFVDVAIS